jgi:hypothetical protein
MANRIQLFVEFSFLDGEFANRDEMDIRNKLTDELESRGFGKFIGAGSGDGSMDFSFWVDDETKARKLLAEVIGKLAPDANYTVQADAEDD